MIDPEFIKRANDICAPAAEDARLLCCRKQREYFQTEKGIIAKKRGYLMRKKRMKKALKNTPNNEIELIKDFYRNCPDGYEVDHIIPISKGGRHILANLQYLTHEENSKKFNKWKGII